MKNTDFPASETNSNVNITIYQRVQKVNSAYKVYSSCKEERKVDKEISK